MWLGVVCAYRFRVGISRDFLAFGNVVVGLVAIQPEPAFW